MTDPAQRSATGAVLYVEDNIDDVFWMQRAFELAGIKHRLHAVDDSDEALSLLIDQADGLPAALVLLDLELRGTSGFDLLKRIRSTPAISTVPVLVMTASNAQADIQRAALLGANGYVVKPASAQELPPLVKSIRDYWLTVDRMSQRVPDEALT